MLLVIQGLLLEKQRTVLVGTTTSMQNLYLDMFAFALNNLKKHDFLLSPLKKQNKNNLDRTAIDTKYRCISIN